MEKIGTIDLRKQRKTPNLHSHDSFKTCGWKENSTESPTSFLLQTKVGFFKKNLMVLILTKSAFLLPHSSCIVVATLWKHRWTGRKEDTCVNIPIFGFILKNLNIFFILMVQSP